MIDRIPPVRRQVVVPVPPEVAFTAWTAEIGAWWPLGKGHSVHGGNGTVAFVDGRLIEQSPDGTAVWGSVVEWSPPDLLRITWHPGRDTTDHTDVTVRFAAVGDGTRTLVTLEHSGWERWADANAVRDGYANGWVTVIGEYAAHAGRAEPGVTLAAVDASVSAGAVGPGADQPVWLALSHTPSVCAPADGNVFEHPLFGEHVRFVLGLQAAGALVGAGPILGRPGHGMTVIRVPAPAAADYVRAAQDEDPSVAGGLLQVDVNVWGVRMTS
jgi:prepilin-type processing-associated H-X9-DG protein